MIRFITIIVEFEEYHIINTMENSRQQIRSTQTKVAGIMQVGLWHLDPET